MFKLMGKKIITILCAKFLLNWAYAIRATALKLDKLTRDDKWIT